MDFQIATEETTFDPYDRNTVGSVATVYLKIGEDDFPVATFADTADPTVIWFMNLLGKMMDQRDYDALPPDVREFVLAHVPATEVEKTEPEPVVAEPEPRRGHRPPRRKRPGPAVKRLPARKAPADPGDDPVPVQGLSWLPWERLIWEAKAAQGFVNLVGGADADRLDELDGKQATITAQSFIRLAYSWFRSIQDNLQATGDTSSSHRLAQIGKMMKDNGTPRDKIVFLGVHENEHLSIPVFTTPGIVNAASEFLGIVKRFSGTYKDEVAFFNMLARNSKGMGVLVPFGPGLGLRYRWQGSVADFQREGDIKVDVEFQSFDLVSLVRMIGKIPGVEGVGFANIKPEYFNPSDWYAQILLLLAVVGESKTAEEAEDRMKNAPALNGKEFMALMRKDADGKVTPGRFDFDVKVTGDAFTELGAKIEKMAQSVPPSSPLSKDELLRMFQPDQDSLTDVDRGGRKVLEALGRESAKPVYAINGAGELIFNVDVARPDGFIVAEQHRRQTLRERLRGMKGGESGA